MVAPSDTAPSDTARSNEALREEVAKLAGELKYLRRKLGEETSRREMTERALEGLSRHDMLTMLPNRALFEERLGQALARRGDDGKLAVMVLNLDRVKAINDLLGHTIGDLLLREVAQRVNGCLRDGDLAGRLGGDEFAIIAQDMASVEAAKTVGAGIVDDVSHPFRVGEHKIGIGASVGISINRGGALGPEEMIRHADAALYAVKNGGRNSRLCFDEMGGGNKSEDAGGDAVAALRQIS